MLGSLIEKISSLLPKSFFIAGLIPVLAVCLVNGLLAYLTSPAMREIYDRFGALPAGKQALVGVPVLATLATLAGLLSALAVIMRRALEGAYLPGSLDRLFVKGQQSKRDELEAQINSQREAWFDLKTQHSIAVRLKNSRLKGESSRSPCKYDQATQAARLVSKLDEARRQHEPITSADLEAAVTALEHELESCYVDDENVGTDAEQESRQLLDSHHTALKSLAEYATNFAESEYRQNYGKRDLYFSKYVLAPTAMGNIAESIRSYARSRYHINLDFVWSRLLKIVQKEESFSTFLSDANTRLDAVITVLWLTVVSTAAWLLYLLYSRQRPFLFLSIGIIGPLLALMWYRIAVQSYLALAEVFRTAIDLYRFNLLKAFHLALPSTRAEEINTWAKLNQIVAYGVDEAINYHHPTQEKK